jgi:hypothetical protein
MRDLDLGKIKYVHVFVKGWNAPLTYTCYEQDEGVWKEENGMGWAHVVQMVRHPTAEFEPRWTPTVSLEYIDHIETVPFMEALAKGGARQEGSA